MGVAYANGAGVDADPAEGLKWLLLAAAAGNASAVGALPQFEARLTTDQAAKGHALAAQWKPVS